MRLVRHSSSIGRLEAHLCFKVKYCHKIFDHDAVRERCGEVMLEAAAVIGVTVGEMGFDRDHVHLVAEIGLLSVPQVAKALKGRTAHFLLREFEWLKTKYFWGSGLWSPAVYFDSIGTHTADCMRAYVREQGQQTKLNEWTNTAGL